MMKKYSWLLILALLSLSACGTQKNTAKDGASAYSGIWLQNEISQYRSSKDPNFICNHLTTEPSGKLNLSIDGLVINENGATYDFQLDGSHVGPIWRINANGSTTENIVLAASAGTFTGHKMKKDSDNQISSVWIRKVSGVDLEEPRVYYRSSASEIQEIQTVAAKCR